VNASTSISDARLPETASGVAGVGADASADATGATHPDVRTKIVATLGPSTDTLDTLRALIRAGMNVARLNFSHGTRAEHARRLDLVREAARLEAAPIAILQDLQGPRLRIRGVRPGTRLEAGHPFVLDARRSLGDGSGVGVDLAHALCRQVRPGHRVLIDDGRICLVVRAVADGRIEAEVVTGGGLTTNKGINLPDTPLALPSLTNKDRADLRFGLAQGVDYIALSFVGSARQVRHLKAVIRREGGDVPVIAKIERSESVVAMDEIVAAADGVMVARGDLALEIGAARVPVVQKALIRAANAAAKPVITATQMLESMIDHPRPTRAETSDVANAILDGTDAVMLSGETAVGAYPVAAVAEMTAIAREAERILAYERLGRRVRPDALGKVTYAISQAAVDIARVVGVKAIIAVTSSGQTARRVARHCPEMPLVGATRWPTTWRRLALVWGVSPVVVRDFDATDEMIQVVGEAAQAMGIVEHGDVVVITSGLPVGRPGSTNMVQVRRIGDWDVPQVLHIDGTEGDDAAPGEKRTSGT